MRFKVVEITVSGAGMTPATGNVTPKSDDGKGIDKFPFGGKPMKRRKKPKVRDMKITKEDIKKYATDKEKRLLEDFYDDKSTDVGEDEGLGNFLPKDTDYEEDDDYQPDVKGEMIQKIIKLAIMSELGDYEKAERMKEGLYDSFAEQMESAEIDSEYQKAIEHVQGIKKILGDEGFAKAFAAHKEEEVFPGL